MELEGRSTNRMGENGDKNALQNSIPTVNEAKPTTPFLSVKFPPTRYQGSKVKLIDWYFPIFLKLEFETVLDVFGGTGVVSHMFKRMLKEIVFNDLLVSNYNIGKALIENKEINFDISEVHCIFKKHKNRDYETIIQDHFQDIYYTQDENTLLDISVQNILQLDNGFEKALCLFSLFQACIQKRPFNLFHRKNLYLRLNNVKRSFGNKKTWDTPLGELFSKALREANLAVFDNHRDNQAWNYPIRDLPLPEEGFDLIYLDPPYISPQGVGLDYRSFYHFLEGICSYHRWSKMIDYQSKHRRLKVQGNSWTNKNQIVKEFENAVEKFQDSILAISYRDPGIPGISALEEILSTYKRNIHIHTKEYKYVLTSRKKRVREVLIVAA